MTALSATTNANVEQPREQADDDENYEYWLAFFCSASPAQIAREIDGIGGEYPGYDPAA